MDVRLLAAGTSYGATCTFTTFDSYLKDTGCEAKSLPLFCSETSHKKRNVNDAEKERNTRGHIWKIIFKKLPFSVVFFLCWGQSESYTWWQCLHRHHHQRRRHQRFNIIQSLTEAIVGALITNMINFFTHFAKWWKQKQKNHNCCSTANGCLMLNCRVFRV